MLHMSSTHQMQQIHPNDLSLICPYVGVRCSLPETGVEQAKKKRRYATCIHLPFRCMIQSKKTQQKKLPYSKSS